MIENGFVHIPETAPWLDEYLHELTAFPKGKHDDQVDSTAQFLDWFKKPFPGQGIFEFYRMRAERRQNPDNPKRYRVRLQAPSGMGAVQTFSVRHLSRAGKRLHKNVVWQLASQPSARVVTGDLRLQFPMKTISPLHCPRCGYASPFCCWSRC